MTLNTQFKFDALRRSGYDGASEDMELAYYLDNGATSPNLIDAEQQYLAAQGYTNGTLHDRWFAYLRAEGYTGTVIDMWAQFWADVA
jgi:hypothetical protein